ncbi:MAG: hypothetical protein IT319_17795 [Anaerolineae bacterium]|nr:hypothetical protein [Anaerolineae bacterium]
MMERISAGSNLIIEVQPESWRLLVNGSTGGSERVLVEAVPGEPLRYGATFGSRRQLPANGMLPNESVQRVVLGWAEEDTSWHLGLVLRGELVTTRGSRWCGLAHWFDPLATQYQKTAIQAGQALAEQIHCPFTFVPPRKSEGGPISIEPRPRSEIPAAPRLEPTIFEPVAEAIPQPELPIKLDLWTLKRTDWERLELTLSPAWGRSKLLRVAWNIVWLGAFIVLTVKSLTSGIALPLTSDFEITIGANTFTIPIPPMLLIYMGIGASILLFIIILAGLYQTLTRIKRIAFEPGGVRWLRGKRARRTVPIDQIQEVYVSHIISKVGRRGKSSRERAVHYGEINLLLKDGSFQLVLIQPHTDDTIPVTDDPLNEEAVVPLTVYNARTRLQSAGLMIAETLNVPASYDKRLR